MVYRFVAVAALQGFAPFRAAFFSALKFLYTIYMSCDTLAGLDLAYHLSDQV